MMNYTANLETVHFVNWLLHSRRGCVGTLVADAAGEARKQLGRQDREWQLREDSGDALKDSTQVALACSLEGQLDELLGEVFEVCSRDELPDFDDGPEWLTDRPLDLFGPYVASGLANIDFEAAASHILQEHAKFRVTERGACPAQ